MNIFKKLNRLRKDMRYYEFGIYWPICPRRGVSGRINRSILKFYVYPRKDIVLMYDRDKGSNRKYFKWYNS